MKLDPTDMLQGEIEREIEEIEAEIESGVWDADTVAVFELRQAELEAALENGEYLDFDPEA